MVTCMAGGTCSDVAGSWYWIYYVGPFLAAWFVAELTVLMEMDVGEADEAPAAADGPPESAKDPNAEAKADDAGTPEVLNA